MMKLKLFGTHISYLEFCLNFTFFLVLFYWCFRFIPYLLDGRSKRSVSRRGKGRKRTKNAKGSNGRRSCSTCGVSVGIHIGVGIQSNGLPIVYNLLFSLLFLRFIHLIYIFPNPW